MPISYYLALSAVLFGLGAIGFVFRRNGRDDVPPRDNGNGRAMIPLQWFDGPGTR